MGFFSPSIQGLMSQRLGPSEQGQTPGRKRLHHGIAGMIGPGLFYDHIRL